MEFCKNFRPANTFQPKAEKHRPSRQTRPEQPGQANQYKNNILSDLYYRIFCVIILIYIDLVFNTKLLLELIMYVSNA